MLGTELDMSSPPFQALMAANAEKLVPSRYILASCRPFLTSLCSLDYFQHVLSLSESSGTNVVSTRFSLPSIFNFNHFSYANGTSKRSTFS